MIKKTYYIRYGEFGNMYDLAWADNASDAEKLVSIGFTKCSRKWAEERAHAEIERQLYNPAFSGYADRAVYPAHYYTGKPRDDLQEWLWRNFTLKGVIWE